MISPILGILHSIIDYGGVNALRDFISAADGFEVRLLDSIKSQIMAIKLKENDKARYANLECAFNDIAKQCLTSKVGLKPAFTSNKKEIEEINKAVQNPNECSICYIRNNDTQMLPCKHTICKICYEMTMRIR